MRQWPLWCAALWWGSLTTLGFGVVPLLFTYLPSAALAGNLAARLFAVQTWVSVALGVALLVASRPGPSSVSGARVGAATMFILGGMLLALLAEFAVAPRIVARDNLPLWHAVGSAMYLAQWSCAGATFRAMVQPNAPVQV